MTVKSKVTVKTKIRILDIVTITEQFNINSKEDNLRFILVPAPFPGENHSSYIQYLTDLKPNLDLTKIKNGSYLESFLTHIKREDYQYINLSKIDINLTKALNNKHNMIRLESVIISEDKYISDLFKKYGI